MRYILCTHTHQCHRGRGGRRTRGHRRHCRAVMCIVWSGEWVRSIVTRQKQPHAKNNVNVTTCWPPPPPPPLLSRSPSGSSASFWTMAMMRSCWVCWYMIYMCGRCCGCGGGCCCYCCLGVYTRMNLSVDIHSELSLTRGDKIMRRASVAKA